MKVTRLALLVIWISTLFTYSAYAQVKEGYAKSQGVDIYYQAVGIGYPVLIINGGPGFNSRGFLPLAQHIADMGYQAILFDQRGTGNSNLTSVDSAVITMDLMAADIEALRNHLGIADWTILGHSFGGIMAYYHITKFPEHISGMIQSSSGGIDLTVLTSARGLIERQLTGEEIDSLGFYRAALRNSEDSLLTRKRYCQILAKAYTFKSSNDSMIAERLMQGNSTINRIVWNDLINSEYDVSSAISNFNRPVLIIQGKEDIVSVSMAEKAKNALPDAQLVVLDSCGHYGWLDQEEMYLRHLETFLSTVK